MRIQLADRYRTVLTPHETDIVRLLFMVPIYSLVTLAAYIFYVREAILSN